jgi:integrase
MSKKKADGSGTIYKRGNIWWVKIHVNGRPVYKSSESKKHADAVKLRNQLLGKKERKEITGGVPDKVLIGELLDDVLKSDIAQSTKYVWEKVINKNIRPYFGDTKAANLTTDLMEKYREARTTTVSYETAKGEKRTKQVSESTVNRELSILRTAFHNARKRTPPKVLFVPHFPMKEETNVREGFLSDDQYAALRDALPEDERILFVVAYNVGTRKGELLQTKWEWVDFERSRISLPPHVTKTRTGRVLPIVPGDMEELLREAKRRRDEGWPNAKFVFTRQGEPITDFRGAWDDAVKATGIPDLTFHDLRRTAVRNMRRAGVPQVIRMKISGHKTDSMERRYNIVDDEDLDIAQKFMAQREIASKRR